MAERLEICVYKLQVMRLAYVERQMERCRNCSEYTMYQCSNFKAYDPSMQIPVSKGRLAIEFMKRFYRDNISLEGLPHDQDEA